MTRTPKTLKPLDEVNSSYALGIGVRQEDLKFLSNRTIEQARKATDGRNPAIFLANAVAAGKKSAEFQPRAVLPAGVHPYVIAKGPRKGQTNGAALISDGVNPMTYVTKEGWANIKANLNTLDSQLGSILK